MDIEQELINEANFANKVTGCSIKQHIAMRAAVEIRKLRELIKKDGICKKCGGEMRQDGIALEQTFCGKPDFASGEVVTMSSGGAGTLISCKKCKDCGYSVRK